MGSYSKLTVLLSALFISSAALPQGEGAAGTAGGAGGAGGAATGAGVQTAAGAAVAVPVGIGAAAAAVAAAAARSASAGNHGQPTAHEKGKACFHRGNGTPPFC